MTYEELTILDRAKTLVSFWLEIEGDGMTLPDLMLEADYISSTQDIGEPSENLRLMLETYLSDEEEVELLAAWMEENYIE